MVEKRTRKNRVSFRLDDVELKKLEENLKLSGKTNREAYLRKMALDGGMNIIDMKPTADLVRLIANIASNVNQIARRCNETGTAYEQDVLELMAQYYDLKPFVVEAHRISVEMRD